MSFSSLKESLRQEWSDYSKKALNEFKADMLQILTIRLKLETFKWWYKKEKVPRRFRFPRDKYFPSESNIKQWELNFLKNIIDYMEKQNFDYDSIRENRVAAAEIMIDKLAEKKLRSLDIFPDGEVNKSNLKQTLTGCSGNVIETFRDDCTNIAVGQYDICNKKIEKAFQTLENLDTKQKEQRWLIVGSPDSSHTREHRNQGQATKITQGRENTRQQRQLRQLKMQRIQKNNKKEKRKNYNYIHNNNKKKNKTTINAKKDCGISGRGVQWKKQARQIEEAKEQQVSRARREEEIVITKNDKSILNFTTHEVGAYERDIDSPRIQKTHKLGANFIATKAIKDEATELLIELTKIDLSRDIRIHECFGKGEKGQARFQNFDRKFHVKRNRHQRQNPPVMPVIAHLEPPKQREWKEGFVGNWQTKGTDITKYKTTLAC